MIELKRCPLCGADGQMKDVHVKIRQGWVGCPECGIYKQWSHDPYQAILRWNRRADRTEEYAFREQIKKAMTQPMKGSKKRRPNQ